MVGFYLNLLFMFPFFVIFQDNIHVILKHLKKEENFQTNSLLRSNMLTEENFKKRKAFEEEYPHLRDGQFGVFQPLAPRKIQKKSSFTQPFFFTCNFLPPCPTAIQLVFEKLCQNGNAKDRNALCEASYEAAYYRRYLWEGGGTLLGKNVWKDRKSKGFHSSAFLFRDPFISSELTRRLFCMHGVDIPFKPENFKVYKKESYRESQEQEGPWVSKETVDDALLRQDIQVLDFLILIKGMKGLIKKRVERIRSRLDSDSLMWYFFNYGTFLEIENRLIVEQTKAFYDRGDVDSIKKLLLTAPMEAIPFLVEDMFRDKNTFRAAIKNWHVLEQRMEDPHGFLLDCWPASGGTLFVIILKSYLGSSALLRRMRTRVIQGEWTSVLTIRGYIALFHAGLSHSMTKCLEKNEEEGLKLQKNELAPFKRALKHSVDLLPILIWKIYDAPDATSSSTTALITMYAKHHNLPLTWLDYFKEVGLLSEIIYSRVLTVSILRNVNNVYVK